MVICFYLYYLPNSAYKHANIKLKIYWTQTDQSNDQQHEDNEHD